MFYYLKLINKRQQKIKCKLACVHKRRRNSIYNKKKIKRRNKSKQVNYARHLFLSKIQIDSCFSHFKNEIRFDLKTKKKIIDFILKKKNPEKCVFFCELFNPKEKKLKI